MKRDIDLARQLLLDIEARGADCSVSVLRTDANHDAEERVRYHLRLLVDAAYLKEVDRTASGVPCLRLTHAGHELIELVRSEARWRQAKWVCQSRTGGLALTVVRDILTQWALAPQRPAPRRRYRPAETSLLVEAPYAPIEPLTPPADWDLASYDDDDAWDYADREPVRYVRVRPERPGAWRPRRGKLNGELAEPGYETALPEFLI